ncbi:unnamed protein product [Agarophyton chilense]
MKRDNFMIERKGYKSVLKDRGDDTLKVQEQSIDWYEFCAELENLKAEEVRIERSEMSMSKLDARVDSTLSRPPLAPLVRGTCPESVEELSGQEKNMHKMQLRARGSAAPGIAA